VKKGKRDRRVYLEDILAAIERIETYCPSGREEFLKEFLVQDAIIRQLSVIGEAAAKLPKSVSEQSAEIPWRQIIGMRNIIIHDYAEINLESVWQTIVGDLPLLKKQVTAMLRKETV
jgi:uncharacterized protein with HEPN domain